MKTVLLGLLFAIAPFVSAAEAPTLTDAEKSAGWKLLFDGTTFTGWRGLGMDDVPKCWTVEDGCLKCLGGTKDANDLIPVDKYENFELAFEWKFPKGKGNSGVKYRVKEEKGKGYAFGPEYQVFSDPKADPMKVDIHSAGALYDLFAPQGGTLSMEGEFNRSRILVQGNHVEHWLNDVKVVSAEFGSDAMNEALAKSHFRKSDWGKEPKGFIALQNHHNVVYFRNLKIRELPAK
jgi:hypothetical protein